MKKRWMVVLLLMSVAALVLTACGKEIDEGKIDVPEEALDQLPFSVEVTGLEDVSGTGKVSLLDEETYAVALSAVKSVYYVADGATVYAADIKIVDGDGKEITVGRPVSVIITMKDENRLPVRDSEVFHVHDGKASMLDIRVEGNKITFAVDNLLAFRTRAYARTRRRE